jgi:hypothetical protein
MPIAVREAILDRFRSLPGAPPFRDDYPSYTQTPSQNLLAGLPEEILEDFAAGDGGELDGDPPKFCAAHSSSALAANAFGPFRLNPERLTLAGLSGFTEATFEQKLPTGLDGTPPNVDFFASGPEGTVAVESKFTEVLSRQTADFKPSYHGAIDRLAEPVWREVYESLVLDPSRFTHLKAAQLVKHYLGMQNALREYSRPQALVYVYWEPTNVNAVIEFSTHRAELAEFAAEVAGSEVQFVALTYAELWAEWEESDTWAGIGDHVEALRARYSLSV